MKDQGLIIDDRKYFEYAFQLFDMTRISNNHKN
jgi:hypothetical protein